MRKKEVFQKIDIHKTNDIMFAFDNALQQQYIKMKRKLMTQFNHQKKKLNTQLKRRIIKKLHIRHNMQ